MIEHEGRLSSLQIDIANLFFNLKESHGFLLAGGGALIAQGLIQRETDDLDFFADRGSGNVSVACDALLAAIDQRGWRGSVIRTGPEFRRLDISRVGNNASIEQVLIDLAIDSPPTKPPMVTFAGPTLAAQDLAVRKTLALFSRAEPRDFADLHELHQHFDRNELLEDAAIADPGFDLAVFAQMLRSHRRLRDDDFPPVGDPIEELRNYFDDWAENLPL